MPTSCLLSPKQLGQLSIQHLRGLIIEQLGHVGDEEEVGDRAAILPHGFMVV
jgi:hypothetical protein